MTLPMPPCARYEGGENDPRCTQVWTYVAGLVGGYANADDLGEAVARVFDYKGQLVVATRHALPAHVEAHFRHAWEVIGCEPGENVCFPDVRSEEWASYWAGRRHESAWTP